MQSWLVVVGWSYGPQHCISESCDLQIDFKICFTEMKAQAIAILSQCITSHVLWEPNYLKWTFLSSLGGWPGVQGGGAEIWTLIKAFIPSHVSESGQWRCCTCNGPAGCSLSPTRPRFSVTYCTRVLRIRSFRPLNPFNRVFLLTFIGTWRMFFSSQIQTLLSSICVLFLFDFQSSVFNPLICGFVTDQAVAFYCQKKQKQESFFA